MKFRFTLDIWLERMAEQSGNTLSIGRKPIRKELVGGHETGQVAGPKSLRINCERGSDRVGFVVANADGRSRVR